jgi:hypothetical protein
MQPSLHKKAAFIVLALKKYHISFVKLYWHQKFSNFMNQCTYKNGSQGLFFQLNFSNFDLIIQ